MNLGFHPIGASTRRLIILTAASAFLLAAGDVPQSDPLMAGAVISDDILAPMSIADATAANAALAASTPADVRADIAAAARASLVAPVPVADVVRPARLTTLVSAMDDADAAVAQDRDLHCLANAVYFESRGEPLEGQLAVAQAILNRVESGRYASSICGVVNQPKQFSFDRTRTPRAGTDWSTAKAIAVIAAQDLWKAVAPKAISFHANYVSPNWGGKTRVAQIGRHIFYR